MRKLHKECFIAVLFASGAFATSEVSGTPQAIIGSAPFPK